MQNLKCRNCRETWEWKPSDGQFCSSSTNSECFFFFWMLLFLLNAAKNTATNTWVLQKNQQFLQICIGHKHKWLTQSGAGPEIARSDTMLNTMLKHTHGVWEEECTHKRLKHTMKDKREASLFFPLYMMYIYSTMVWLLVSYSKVTWTPLWLFAFHTYPCRIRCSNIPP